MRTRVGISSGVTTVALLAMLLAACSGSGSSSGSAAAPGATPRSTMGPSSVAAVPSSTSSPNAPSAAASEVAATYAPASAPSSKPRPSFDPKAIAAYLTASITLFDLADADLGVDVRYVAASSGSTTSLGTYVIGASEQLAESVPPGTYRLEFRLPSSASTNVSCTIAVTDGAAFTFIAVPGAIAVTRAGFTPTSGAGLFVATSSLCKA